MKSKEKDVTSVCPKKVGRICILLFSELLYHSARSFTRPRKGEAAAGEALLPSFAVTSDVTPKSTSGNEKRCFAASLLPDFDSEDDD